MAIIYSYPRIGTLDLQDLMIISDVQTEGNPTKSVTLSQITSFIKGTPTDIICPECNKVMDPDGVIAQETDLGFAISHEGLKSLMDIIKPAIQEELDKLWTRKNESLPARKEVQLCKKTV